MAISKNARVLLTNGRRGERVIAVEALHEEIAAKGGRPARVGLAPKDNQMSKRKIDEPRLQKRTDVVFEITAGGRVLRVTGDQRVVTSKGPKAVDKLTIGDLVMMDLAVPERGAVMALRFREHEPRPVERIVVIEAEEEVYAVEAAEDFVVDGFVLRG